MEIKEHLRSAQPHLISCVHVDINGRRAQVTGCIRATNPPHEVIDEGYDPDNSPLGPVYWRIVQRDDGKFYLSTFLASRDAVSKAWGTEGLAYCDPVTGMAAAQIETDLSQP